MSAWPTPQALVAQVALSEPVRVARQQIYRGLRVLRSEAPTLDAFVRLADPYSLLLLRELPALLAAFDVELRLHWLDDTLPPEYEPNAERRAAQAPRDAALLARALGDRLDAMPAQPMHDAVQARAVAMTDDAQDGWLARVLDLAEAWWRGDTDVLTKAVQRVDTLLLEKARQHGRYAARRLLALGHYEAASVTFDGSWYAGIERLHYLTERLDGLGLLQNRDVARQLRTRERALRPGIGATGGADVEFYFSFRSPFSYLAACTTFALANKSRLDVTFRPVLPMVSRGQPLPNAKRYYIVADANREARRLGIAFGRIADPLDAAPDLIRLAALAEREGRIAEFVLAAGHASWAEGIDLRRHANLVAVARGAGLLPTAIRRALNDDAPVAAAEANMQRLNAAGLWGVPSFKLGERAHFGQDRLALMLNDSNGEGA